MAPPSVGRVPAPVFLDNRGLGRQAAPQLNPSRARVRSGTRAAGETTARL